jgi:RNAse (barnase) inhibitor barstar
MRILELTFDGATLRSVDDFHAELARQTGVEWYGRNRDALDEMLAFIIFEQNRGPFTIEWRSADKSMDRLRDDFDRLVGMFKIAQDWFPDRLLDVRLKFSRPYFEDGSDVTGQAWQ